MPRLQGVDVPTNKATYISLTYLYGVGQRTALEICHLLDINATTKAKDLTDDELARLNNFLDKGEVFGEELMVEGQLRRSMQQDIGRLKDIGCYRGIRHRRGLPVRGQRTRTNSRTRKGAKKTVAGKKGVKDMKH